MHRHHDGEAHQRHHRHGFGPAAATGRFIARLPPPGRATRQISSRAAALMRTVTTNSMNAT